MVRHVTLPEHPHNAEREVFRRFGGVLHPRPAPRLSRFPAREPSAPESATSDMSRLIAEWSGTVQERAA